MEKKDLIAKIRELYDPRKGIHLTDCTRCIRYSFYEKVDPLPIPYSRLIAFFVGTSVHEKLEKILGKVRSRTVQGIICTPDALTDDQVLEFKTSRLDIEDVYSNKRYIRQLKAYVHVFKKSIGVLIVIGLYEMDIYTRSFKFTKEELKKNWDFILRRKKLLEQALVTNIPPSVTESDKEEHSNCEYLERCSEELLWENLI